MFLCSPRNARIYICITTMSTQHISLFGNTDLENYWIEVLLHPSVTSAAVYYQFSSYFRRGLPFRWMWEHVFIIYVCICVYYKPLKRIYITSITLNNYKCLCFQTWLELKCVCLPPSQLNLILIEKKNNQPPPTECICPHTQTHSLWGVILTWITVTYALQLIHLSELAIDMSINILNFNGKDWIVSPIGPWQAALFNVASTTCFCRLRRNIWDGSSLTSCQ